MFISSCWTPIRLALLLAPWIVWCAPAAEVATPACENFFFTVHTTARNDSGTLIPAMTSKISAEYCPPTKKVAGRDNTVQLLHHGATFTKYYWSCFGPVGTGYHEKTYGWIDHFRNEGFHTVAIDRLGAGNSTQPNSTYVTALLEVDVTLALVEQLRSGVPLPKKFDRFILVGHSYASFILDLLLYKAPKVAEAFILTGYAHNFTLAADAGKRQDIIPANQVSPQKFGKLDSGYMTVASAEACRVAFYGNTGSFDPAFPRLEFETETAQPEGEQDSTGPILATGFATLPASNFTASLALVIGAQDNAFCNGNCNSGANHILSNAKEIYPNVKGLLPMIVPDTGHVLNLHYSAPETYKKISQWLTTQGI